MKETKLTDVLTHAHKKEMISFLQKHPHFFDEAITLCISDHQPYAWRAAWLLHGCMEENDPRIKKHIDPILKCILKKERGHQRELIKILMAMDLNEIQEGLLFDICVNLWEQTDLPPSVRHTAFTFIHGLAEKYPALSNEIAILTQTHYLESLSPGIRNSIVKKIATHTISE